MTDPASPRRSWRTLFARLRGGFTARAATAPAPAPAAGAGVTPPGVPVRRAWLLPAAIAGGIALLAAQAIVVVPAGHRGVLTTFGRVAPGVLAEGLHFRVPVAQQITLMSVQVQKGEGGDVAASRDLQHVNVKVALNYRLDPPRAAEVFQRVGTLPAVGERIIQPAVHEAVKAGVAQFTAEELVTQRAEVRARIRRQLDARLLEHGVIVEELSIVSFGFSRDFEQAIEDKSKAEQLRLKAERDLARIKVEAEQQVAKAEAEAQTLVLQRKAEAEALALQRAQITPELLQWEAVRRWDGKLPEVVAGGGAPLQLPLQVPQAPRPAR